MTFDHFLAMFAFSFAMSATPGPNIVLLLASGVNFGVRRTIPHMIGIPLGLAALLLAVGLGLGALFFAIPGAQTALKIVSIAYMLYLAWAVATAAPMSEGKEANGARPMTLLEGALFQWVNPKAWVMALGAVSAYTLPDRYALSLAILIGVMVAISLPISLAWTSLGAALRRLLTNRRAHITFNLMMAALLLLSLWPIVTGLSRA